MKGVSLEAIQGMTATCLERVTGSEVINRFTKLLALTRLKLHLSTKKITKHHYTANAVDSISILMNMVADEAYDVCELNDRIHLLVLDDDKADCIKIAIEVGAYENVFNIVMTGDPTTVDMLNARFDAAFVKNGHLITTIVGVSDRGVKKHQSFICKEDVQQAHQCFYPKITVPLDDYFKAFMQSKENVLILFGEPGTGKSTFTRSLISSGDYSSTLVYYYELMGKSEVINDYMKSDNNILVYEDCDVFLAKRENGNPIMSTFLNAADGIMRKLDKKIIFHTNLSSINKIDPALMRVGRCFDILHFDYLTPQEAMNITVEMNLDSQNADFSSKKGWTLAEVLQKPVPEQQMVNRFASKISF